MVSPNIARFIGWTTASCTGWSSFKLILWSPEQVSTIIVALTGLVGAIAGAIVLIRKADTANKIDLLKAEVELSKNLSHDNKNTLERMEKKMENTPVIPDIVKVQIQNDK